MRAAKHLTLQHFEAIARPLDRASRPGHRHPSSDRLVVLIQPFRKALQGFQRARGRALQPGIKLGRWPLADQCSKIFGEIDRLGHLGLLGAQLRELLGLSFRPLPRASQHQPGRPAWRQGLARRLSHRGQGLARAAVPGRQALSLPQAAGLRRNHAIAPSIATLAEVAKQPHRGVAPRIPALEEIRLIGVKDTLPAVTATPAPRKRGTPEIALHGAQTHPEALGNGRGRPALAVQGPDLRMQRLPARLALRCALLRREGNIVGWDGHRNRPVGERHRLLVHQGIDGIEGRLMREEHLVQGFPKILEQMNAVGHLGRGGRPVPRALGIGSRAIPRDHFDPWMLPEPLRDGVGGTLREERDWGAALQSDQHRAIRLAFAQGEIIHAEDGGRGK